jgi:DNA-binding XRE family transcriptional regulator
METTNYSLLTMFEELREESLTEIKGGQSEDIASNLKMLRVTSGMTRDSLAELLRVDPTAVTHWEHGRRIPDIDTLIEIAKLFDTTVDNLVK